MVNNNNAIHIMHLISAIVGGLEIEDILGGEFEAEERYLLSPLSTSSKSKQKVATSYIYI